MTTALAGKPAFGAGRAFASPLVTNPSPSRFLTPQSQSINLKRKVESLFGENQLAVAVGAGTMEVTGKVEYAKSVASVLGSIMLGDSSSTGSYVEADGELQTVAASTPYICTVTNATNFVEDLGVVAVATGVRYVCVAAGLEAAGVSYSVVTTGANKGKYTFAAADTGLQMKISYLWSNASAGASIVMANALQGLTGAFQAVHVFPWGTEQDIYVMNSCIASGSGLSSKQSGFGMTTMEYTASVDGNGNLGTASFAEAW